MFPTIFPRLKLPTTLVFPTTGVREGISLGGRKHFALKITICPETNFLVESEWSLKPNVNLFYTVQFVYNGFVCNVNSPITLHVVRPWWHLLLAFQFAYNVNSAITFFMQSPTGAVIANSVVTLLVNLRGWSSLHVVFSQTRNFTVIAFTDANMYATSMAQHKG